MSRPPYRRALVIAGLALLVLALAGAGVLGYVAWTNKVRADEWRLRATQLSATVAELERLLDERTRALNERTTDLNEMADKVVAAERSIARSEADVNRLEQRQRELAAEKAKVEDARAALALQAAAIEDVAQAYVECSNGLGELLSHVLNENYDAASAIVNRVDSDCTSAETALDQYSATYD